ncbi:hypothetical protein F511_24675 [Dorcoceras hygrometricum]|uniref:Uncharacterized protein n=1 Tax=Dorcoceras hygrometricum TaxID=472368 RepID=A0A2Z7DDB4_9LAMI|nr:hypothetical protein F511_24675 [Dorcoceras hygrometricum]
MMAIDGNRVRMNSSIRRLSGKKIGNLRFENALSVDQHLHLNSQSKLQQKSSVTNSDVSPTQMLVPISFHSKAEVSQLPQLSRNRLCYSLLTQQKNDVVLTYQNGVASSPASSPQILVTAEFINQHR